jgi:hypothetical protein
MLNVYEWCKDWQANTSHHVWIRRERQWLGPGNARWFLIL